MENELFLAGKSVLYKANPYIKCSSILTIFLDSFYCVIEDIIGTGIYNHTERQVFREESTLLNVKVIVTIYFQPRKVGVGKVDVHWAVSCNHKKFKSKTKLDN